MVREETCGCGLQKSPWLWVESALRGWVRSQGAREQLLQQRRQEPTRAQTAVRVPTARKDEAELRSIKREDSRAQQRMRARKVATLGLLSAGRGCEVIALPMQLWVGSGGWAASVLLRKSLHR